MTPDEFKALPDVRLQDVQAGTVLITDGFPTSAAKTSGCLKPFAPVTVEFDPREKDGDQLFVRCSHGHHCLSGQVDGPDNILIGMKLRPEQTA